MADISIVFVNYHMKEDIFRALQSVLEDLRDSPYEAHITVVDNSGNADHIKEGLKHAFPSVNYLDSGGNLGFGKGTTLGFKAFPARYYFALNRDTKIAPGTKTTERIIRFMDEHPFVGCAGPKLVYPDGRLQYSCFRFDLVSILIKPFKHVKIEERVTGTKKFVDRLLMADFDHEKTVPVDWVLGAALIARAEAIKEVGWFDERYFMYLEDCDWCRSMWEKGWPVYYIHDIEIEHTHERQSAKVPGLKAIFLNKLARIHISSWLKYLIKWFGRHRSYANT